MINDGKQEKKSIADRYLRAKKKILLIPTSISVDGDDSRLCGYFCEHIYVNANDHDAWAACELFKSDKTGENTILKYHSGAGGSHFDFIFYRCAKCLKSEKSSKRLRKK